MRSQCQSRSAWLRLPACHTAETICEIRDEAGWKRKFLFEQLPVAYRGVSGGLRPSGLHWCVHVCSADVAIMQDVNESCMTDRMNICCLLQFNFVVELYMCRRSCCRCDNSICVVDGVQSKNCQFL